MTHNIRNTSFTVFVVVGKLPKSLTLSKVAPIAVCDRIGKVFVFRREKGYDFQNVNYITLPNFINKIKITFIKRIIRWFYEPIQLLIYALKYKPDYINGIYTLPKGFNSVLISKLIGCRSIVSVIGGQREIENYYKFKSDIKKKFWKKISIWILKSSYIVTTKGNNDISYLVNEGISKDKMFVFNGAIDTDKFKHDNTVKDIDVLFVGGFDNRKGPDRVVEVIKKLSVKFPDIKSCLLGKGALFIKVRKLISSYGLEKNIRMIGYTDNTSDYFKRAKILLMPSAFEGLATAMLEAMSCGCVPVVTGVNNMKEAAWHNINAMVVDDYTNIELFAEYAGDLLSDKNKWQAMSMEGQKIVKEKYSVEAQLKDFENILNYKKQR